MIHKLMAFIGDFIYSSNSRKEDCRIVMNEATYVMLKKNVENYSQCKFDNITHIKGIKIDIHTGLTGTEELKLFILNLESIKNEKTPKSVKGFKI